jgi:hypothetical protein
MSKHDSPASGTIYFVHAVLAETIHCGGFTDHLHLFCWGEDRQQAEANARAYLLGNGVVVKKFAGATPALQQNPAKYVYPEQIYGLPDAIAQVAIRSQSWLSAFGESTLKTLKKKQAQLREGHQRLVQLAMV